MTSNRPYLIRAIYQWLVDNQMSPHVIVNALRDDTEVPQDYVTDGQIVLNLRPSAITGLSMENDAIRFLTRFNGISTEISFSPDAVMGIYAAENGQGMLFPEETQDSGDEPPPQDGPGGGKPTARGSKGRANLRVVK